MSQSEFSKTQTPIRVLILHDDAGTDAARKLRASLSRRRGLEFDLAEDFGFEGTLRRLKTADIVTPLFTADPTLGYSEVLQHVGAAKIIDKPIFPLVTERHILNLFSGALRPDHAHVLESGNFDTPEGREKLAAKFFERVTSKNDTLSPTLPATCVFQSPSQRELLSTIQSRSQESSG
ncbi:MAG: hypothetical protein ABSF12_26875 [Bryobacteraceae bacterium]|jgi:hypothetical protein